MNCSAEGASLNWVNLSGKSTSIGRSSGERQGDLYEHLLATKGENLSGTEDRVVGI